MLEFIILGQVPGTTIEITFKWVLVIAATILATYDFYRVMRRKQSNDVIKHKEISI